jgi:hypothetical protein
LSAGLIFSRRLANSNFRRGPLREVK